MGVVDIVCKCPEKIGFSFGGGCCGRKEEDPPPPHPPPTQHVPSSGVPASSSIVFMYDDSLTIVGPGNMVDARIAEKDESVGKWDIMVLNFPNHHIVSLHGKLFGRMCDAAGGECVGRPLSEIFTGSFLSVLTAALELLTTTEGATIQFNCLFRTKPVTILVYALFGTSKQVVGATVVCRPTRYTAPDLRQILAMGTGRRTSRAGAQKPVNIV